MARRPLPRILSTGSAQIARGRELARTAADSATDVLHPLISITRGLRRLAAAGRRKWADTPKDRRGPLLFLVASVVLVVALLPYGPLLAVISVMAAAAWHGREQRTPPAPEGPDESQAERLNSLYEALVPYFSLAGDPSPLYAHGGEWQKAFPEYAFDESGRVTQLVIRYPAYFTDGEIDSRTRIEQLLHAKCGRGREYHFAWDEEGNRLTVTVLPPLPTDVAAQRFVTAPGETVLGITDPTQVRRTLPLTYGEEQRDVPPVVWRTGVRSTEPHLLIMGQPGSGTSSLLRSIALQALHHGDVVIVEGGTGEYACFTGRKGVLAVECGLTGALASLEWAATETERRLIAANRARQSGHPPPEDTRRPLWLLLDRPSAFAPLAAADGRKDPQSLLQVPLRHGRAANVTVVVADQFDHADALSDAVRQHTRARVVLGPATADQLAGVLGALPATTPAVDVPPGRGYARLGAGPVHRLQVPSTPDPYDDETGEADREAVLALLPPRTTPLEAETIDAAHTDQVEAEPLDPDRFQTQSDDIEPTDAEPTAVNPADAKPLDMKKAPVEEEEPETEPLPTKAVAAEAP
ncbi:ATP-binding protein [Streptomyces sp. NPDC050788]|uniref:ATP-binding protein n=1 Tax=Streptomyces sp. NPDC050788 TaxID=3155041 RepID=UPI00343607E6